MTDNNERAFELAHGVRISRDPETLSREELIDTLYQIAEYGSQQLISARTLRNLIGARLK